MGKVAASLAAALAGFAIASCGSGAEPGASSEATLVLDFTPNAVHAGIYTALAEGRYSDAGVELELREPSNSTDAPKLLEAGRADFAILDIHDLALARERGLDLVGIGALVDRPLAAVIAADAERVRRPADLEGAAVGVTGLPSDEAVLDSVLAAGGADPDAVERVTIGFDSVAALSAGRLAAATAFWNAEGVALRDLGVDTREFRVDEFGAPRYPELVLTATAETVAERPDLVEGVLEATAAGQATAIERPAAALDHLLEAVPALEPGPQRAQLEALLDAGALSPDTRLDRTILRAWARWDLRHGIVSRLPQIDEAFAFEAGSS
jgi:NitT/TauT family transport system substrate-binding protein/putative hydroxymethylpyrimidine transport system substrate-binding protein